MKREILCFIDSFLTTPSDREVRLGYVSHLISEL